MSKLLHNKHHNTAPTDAIYIGRGSLYGNPYVIGKDGTRDDVCNLFEQNILPTLDVEPLRNKHLVCFCKPARCHGQSILKKLYTFTWATKGDGYECSSKGDKRFSAFYARLNDGRTIEQHYQCDVKGYDIGGTNWKLGKGKPPLIEMSQEALFIQYLYLWEVWSLDHMQDLRDLYKQAIQKNNLLTDMFATTPVNQAHALSIILNELCSKNI